MSRAGGKAVVLAALVAAALAGVARAQGGGLAPLERAKWPDLHRAFVGAISSHAAARIKLQESDRQLAAIESALAPLRTKLADLSRRPTSDPELAAAQKALHERILALRAGEHQVEHTRLVQEEIHARGAAIEAGWKALEKMFVVADRIETLNRPEQREDLLNKCYQVMKDLDALESMPGPRLSEFKPLDLAPMDPKTPFDFLIASREEEALYAERLVEELGPRIARNEIEKRQLMKLVDAKVMMGDRVQDNLTSVDARLIELTRARDAASERARALRDEAARLRKRKDEVRREIFKNTSEKR